MHFCISNYFSTIFYETKKNTGKVISIGINASTYPIRHKSYNNLRLKITNYIKLSVFILLPKE